MANTTIFTKELTPGFYPSYDNGKTGGKNDHFMAIGYYPGRGYLYFKNTGELVADIVGTCGCVDCSECQKKCYAVSMCKRYREACKHRIENTLQLRQDIDKHFIDIQNRIIDDRIKVVRYTDSGEIESYRQFFKLVSLALSLPKVRFYLYTKNYAVLREYFGGKYPFTLPANLVVLVSVWGDTGLAEYNEFKHHKNIKAFVVNSTLKPDAMCPAYKKINGKVKLNKKMTCARCGLCWGKKPGVNVIGCLEH